MGFYAGDKQSSMPFWPQFNDKPRAFFACWAVSYKQYSIVKFFIFVNYTLSTGQTKVDPIKFYLKAFSW